MPEQMPLLSEQEKLEAARRYGPSVADALLPVTTLAAGLLAQRDFLGAMFLAECLFGLSLKLVELTDAGQPHEVLH